MKRLLVVDNYDSFTFNLVQYLGELGARPTVVRNDAIDVPAALDLGAQGVLLSPGPGNPDSAGICLSLIEAAAARRVPLLGVCLGHQAIGQAFGARVIRAGAVVHGKGSPVRHDAAGVFAGLPSPFVAGRYHSLALDRSSLPEALVVTARTDDGEVMGVRHRALPIEGVQFHPESILTEHGHALLGNWLATVGRA